MFSVAISWTAFIIQSKLSTCRLFFNYQATEAADQLFLPKKCSFFQAFLIIFIEHLQNFQEA